MMADPPPDARGLGGLAALAAYRAARATSRGTLRAGLKANRAALRSARIGALEAPAPEPAAQACAPPPEAVSVFASLVGAERDAAPPTADEALPEAPKAMAATLLEAIAEAKPPPAAPEPEAEAAPVAPEPEPEPVALATAPAAEPQPETVAAAPSAIEEPAAEPALPPVDVQHATAETDLSAIQELGPGMRHRLAALGYRTCGDLAAAEPSRLAQQLGEISRLLRLERWIAAARGLRG
jgi:predicted flap endonuclease-1-like 5' DNA nuclease